MNPTVLAVDLGGTHYRVGVASSDNPAFVHPIGAWPTPSTRDEFVAMLESQLADLGATRLGLAIPGLADGTTCRWVPNLSYLDGLDLAASFPQVDVALGNDAHLALLAEASTGAAAELSDAILLAIGTGIGSAVLADGHIIGGRRGGACSFGWAAADLVDPEEDRNGWLELHCSGQALDRVAVGIGLRDGADLVERARAGDSRAIDSLLPPMRALGAALASAVALLDPEAIIFAGGVAVALDILAPLIRRALVSRLPPHMRGVELRAAQFGPRASLVGAAFAGARGVGWRGA